MGPVSRPQSLVLVSWSALIIGLLLGVLLQPGTLLLRDMAVVDHPALSSSALGFGDLPARNAPQDGFLALVGAVFPASWIARLILLGSAGLGAYGAATLARSLLRSTSNALLPQLVAITFTLANPFTIERLLQGHWSLVVAAWLLPGIFAWGLLANGSTSLRAQLFAQWLSSLTPTGAVASALVAVTTSKRPTVSAIFGLLCALPWLIPSLLSVPQASSSTAFSLREEGQLGLFGTMLALGGIWNTDVTPDSRTGWAPWVGVALAAIGILGARYIFQRPRIQAPALHAPAHPAPALQRLLILATAALVAAYFLASFPDFASWVFKNVPGTALFRDSQKLLIFVIPALVALLSAACLQIEDWCKKGRRQAIPHALNLGILALCLLSIWDAPVALQQMKPIPEAKAWSQLADKAAGRDVLIADASSSIVTYQGRTVVDPRSKAVSLVESGVLSVDGVEVDPATPRFLAAQDAYQRHDLPTLAELGVGIVVEPDGSFLETDAPAQRGWQWWLGLVLSGLWISLAALALRMPRRFAAKKSS